MTAVWPRPVLISVRQRAKGGGMRGGLSFLRVMSLAITPVLAGPTALLTGPGAVRGPSAVTGPGTLSGVAALSAQYAWAVGDVQVGSTLRPLIEHWNGTAWRRVASPGPAGNDTLSGVAATSPANAWVVGESGDRTLILHWNGASWRRFAAPSPKNGAIYAIAATSASNAWAAGIDQNHLGFTDIVIEHWTGQRWRPVTSPVQQGLLDGVAAPSAGRAWAVGSPEQLNTSLILTWNGTAWH
jgi:hypothetical protein